MTKEILTTKLALLEQANKTLMEKFDNYAKENEKQHANIMESLQDFHQATNNTLKSMEDKLDKALEKKADKVIVDMMGKTIGDLQGNFKWVSYTVIGSVILGVIGFVFFK